jgi:hypothetical protein
MLFNQFLPFLTPHFEVVVQPLEDVSHAEVILRHARTIRNNIRNDSSIRLVEIDLPGENISTVLSTIPSNSEAIGPCATHLCRLIRLANLSDSLPTLPGYTASCELGFANNDIILLFQHFALANDGHKILSSADLALQASPYLGAREDGRHASWIYLPRVCGVDGDHVCPMSSERKWLAEDLR